MKFKFLKQSGSKKLIAFFAGFASDENLLSGIALPSDADTAIFFDYRNPDCDFDFSQYHNIDVIAWSFGVWAADFAAEKIGAGFAVAVNGSPFPIDDSRGISREVFERTTDTFDEKNKTRFFRRICGGASEYANYANLLCARTAAELKSELEALREAFAVRKSCGMKWNVAIISKGDKIFSADNLRRAFSCDIVEIGGDHLNVSAFEKAFELAASHSSNIKKAFEKNLQSYDEHAFVQREICRTLVDDIKNFAEAELLGGVANVLEIGCGTGMLTSALAKDLRGAKWHLNDLSRIMCERAAQKIYGEFSILDGDIRDCSLGEKFDLIISSSCLQWIPNLSALFAKLAAHSSDGALLAFSTFGEQNYVQIKNILGKGLDYCPTARICEKLEEAGFNVLYTAEDILDVEFNSPIEVLRHIKSTGVNGNFSEFWTPAKLKNFLREYSLNYSHEGGVKLSYNPIYVIAQKKY